MDSYASRGRKHSGDNQLEYRRDSREPYVWPRKDPEEEASDGSSSSNAEGWEVEEAEDVEPGRVPTKDKVVTWIASSPTFHGEPHYEIGIDFD